MSKKLVNTNSPLVLEGNLPSADFQQSFNTGETIQFDTPTIVLASNSPARAKMLDQAGIKFIKLLSNFDDATLNDTYPHQNVSKRQEAKYARTMALAKLEPFVGKVKNGAIITADTTLLCQGRILEKPITKEKCREQHEFISGKTTYLYTAIAIYFNGKTLCKIQKIKVKIKPLPDHIIEEICNEPETLNAAGFRRAGALKPYTIASNPETGGMCIPLVRKMLRKIGFSNG